MHRYMQIHKHTYTILNMVLHVRENIVDISKVDDIILTGTCPPYCKASNLLFPWDGWSIKGKVPKAVFCPAFPVQAVAITGVLPPYLFRPCPQTDSALKWVLPGQTSIPITDHPGLISRAPEGRGQRKESVVETNENPFSAKGGVERGVRACRPLHSDW